MCKITKELKVLTAARRFLNRSLLDRYTERAVQRTTPQSAAMKHEKSSTMAVAGNGSMPPLSLKRQLQQQQHLTDSSNPRSPITKAFDFLPWSRSRSKAAAVAAGSKASSCDAMESAEKPAEVHYQRNIFRSGGGLIRDMLVGSDKEKLQKEKPPQSPQSVAKQKQRKQKQLARNKSLDIRELIGCIDGELSPGRAIGQSGASAAQRFLDDTYIESKSRHILFNDDENTVHIIKKEQPVASTHRTPSAAAAVNGGDAAVVKARLKFKRVPSEHYAASPEALRRAQQLYQRSEQRHMLQRRKSLSDSHYEQQSSSSVSSGGSCSGHHHHHNGTSSSSYGACNGIMMERPKTDKPRKKLSFREPIEASSAAGISPVVVAAMSSAMLAEEQRLARQRRRSSPLERQNVLLLDNCDNLCNNNRTKDAISCASAASDPEVCVCVCVCVNAAYA